MSAPSMYRRHLINGAGGYKAVHLIGTQSPDGVANLALFSSVVHIGASPPIQGMIMRPLTVERQTYDYIKHHGVYTINHVHLPWIDKAHQASAKYDSATSEYEACGLTAEYIPDLAAPFVGESHIKLGMRYLDEYPIAHNGTIMIIGTIEHLLVSEKALDSEGHILPEYAEDAVVSGLERYYKVEHQAHFPFARVGQWPVSKT